VSLPYPINADRFDLIPTDLRKLGEELVKLIAENRHALRLDPQFRHDPEEIWNEDVERMVIANQLKQD
jgi:hypothetical protein